FILIGCLPPYNRVHASHRVPPANKPTADEAPSARATLYADRQLSLVARHPPPGAGGRSPRIGSDRRLRPATASRTCQRKGELHSPAWPGKPDPTCLATSRPHPAPRTLQSAAPALAEARASALGLPRIAACSRWRRSVDR